MENVPGKENTELLNYPADIPIFSLSGEGKKKKGKGKKFSQFY